MEKKQKVGRVLEFGLRQAQTRQSRTRRRPKRQDYAAAKDAAFDKLRRGKGGKRQKVRGWEGGE
jgi:hypothetical protein